MIKRHTYSCLIAFSMILAGCSSFDSDWPSLTDPVPSADERERVVESASPSKYEEPMIDTSPMTLSVAIKQLTAIQAELKKADQAYKQALLAFKAENDDKVAAWGNAQIMLTRYSRILIKLDSIREASSLDGTPVQNRPKRSSLKQKPVLR